MFPETYWVSSFKVCWEWVTSDILFSSHKDSKACSCFASSSSGGKPTQHFTEMGIYIYKEGICQRRLKYSKETKIDNAVSEIQVEQWTFRSHS